ncbi:3-ketoacyl-CoA thiolase 1, peroxisomal-like [Aristolochia californica]|uniref:3-ketoacyl-CoA thiolase 1, peroxisomal-like n=1 Tax=Aristolochia californica TaxID=171875 RepID=UPI0035D8618D
MGADRINQGNEHEIVDEGVDLHGVGTMQAGHGVEGNGRFFHCWLVFGVGKLTTRTRELYLAQRSWNITETHPEMNLVAAAVMSSFPSTDNSTSDTTNLGALVTEQALLPNTENDAYWVAVLSRASQPQHLPTEEANGFFHQMISAVSQGSSRLQAVTAVAATIQAGFDDCKSYGVEGSIHPKINNFQQAPDFLPLGITFEYDPHRIGVTKQKQNDAVVLSHKQAAAETASVATMIIDTKNQEEKNAKLKTVFKKDGTTTTGNSSQVSDGAVMGMGPLVAISAMVKAFNEGVVLAPEVMVLNRIGVCYSK